MHRRLRTRLSSSLLALGVALVIGVGASQGVPQGGSVTIALPAQPETLNPVLPGELSSNIVAGALFAGLTVQHPETFEIVPYLADSWEANDSVTAWTFHLNPNARWHDGEPLTAEDVKFTFDRVLDPAENAQGYPDVKHIESVEVVDAHTVTFHLKQVDGLFPDRLALGNLQPLPKHLFEKYAKLSDAVELNSTRPVGSGPFKMASLQAGSYIELARFDDFFLGRPNLDSLIFSIVPDMNVRVARLRAGDVDWTDIEPTHAAALANDRKVEVIPVSSSRYAILDFAFEGPYAFLFEDPRVRIAMSHAIDQDLILEKVGLGRGWKMDDRYIPFVLSEIPAPDYEPYGYDPERAKELLAEAGWADTNGNGVLDKDGKEFAFPLLVDRGNVQREQIGLILQDAFNQLGMDVEYVAAERTGRWIEDTRARTFAARLAEFPVPNVDWFRRIYTTDGPNARGYKNAEVDALVDAAIRTSDRAAQGEFYKEAQELLHLDPPVVPFFLREQLMAVNARVGNMPRGELKLSTPFTYQLYVEDGR